MFVTASNLLIHNEAFQSTIDRIALFEQDREAFPDLFGDQEDVERSPDPAMIALCGRFTLYFEGAKSIPIHECQSRNAREYWVRVASFPIRAGNRVEPAAVERYLADVFNNGASCDVLPLTDAHEVGIRAPTHRYLGNNLCLERLVEIQKHLPGALH